MMNKREKMTTFVLAMVCVLINLSQLPTFVEKNQTNLLSNAAIMIAGGYALLICFSKKELLFGKTAKKNMILLMLFFLAAFVVAGINTNTHYFDGSMARCLYISVLLYFIGYILGENITAKTNKYIAIFYVLTTCILAFVIYKNNLAGVWNESRLYAYASKNSVSNILFTGVVLALLVLYKGGKVWKIASIVSAIGLTVIVFMLKSRATIICYVVFFIYMLLFSNTTRKRKFLLCLLVGTLCIAIFSNEEYARLIVEDIILGNRAGGNLDEISSGRVRLWWLFPIAMQGNWLLGIGKAYFECFYLSAILNFGLVAGGCLIMYVLYPIKWIFSQKRESAMQNCFAVIAISYCINGIFEGLAPLGPGAKCYFLWLCFGLLSKQQDIKKTVGEKNC